MDNRCEWKAWCVEMLRNDYPKQFQWYVQKDRQLAQAMLGFIEELDNALAHAPRPTLEKALVDAFVIRDNTAMFPHAKFKCENDNPFAVHVIVTRAATLEDK